MKSVLMLLANGVEPLEMAAFTDVLGWADLLGDDSLELVHAGLRRRIITTFGITISPNYLLRDLDTSAFDALALPGGFEPAGFYEEALSEQFLSTIRDFVDAGKIVASVCVASVCLGAAGVLRGKNATTYHQEGGKRKNQLLETGARFVDRPVVVDGQIITSSGPGTATEVAFQLLEQLTSAENAAFIRQKMRFASPGPEWYDAPQVP
ncbi:4-methyl-5(b-hydroxyethyl)-thiazole monophosphate biosynthesis [Pseudomonas helmanticensis]|uniref:4-methyl-5(B-hydroxyethyl)-thiazole monophosphate biosynthesis n=1 Tax=Pseudomonas helmanticensis TaxID=1471381 RepID=A0ACD2UDC9_9PSED|nr:DJ-1/PfpI family protein [Pseudomonas helmanticensis]SMQ30394.1 4-methyl-5(b-hydroxyethyl)-thiazole monophosphate biosynthesis [Pseudomonas helmanticensis]